MIINPRLRGSLRHYKTRTPWCPPTTSLSTLQRRFRMCRGSGEATPFLHFPPCPSSAPGHRRRLCTWQMTTGGRLVFSFSFNCLFVDFLLCIFHFVVYLLISLLERIQIQFLFLCYFALFVGPCLLLSSFLIKIMYSSFNPLITGALPTVRNSKPSYHLLQQCSGGYICSQEIRQTAAQSGG